MNIQLLSMPRQYPEGEGMADKISIYQIGKGSTVVPYVACVASIMGNMSRVVICAEAESVIAKAGIMSEIPMVHELCENLLDVSRSETM